MIPDYPGLKLLIDLTVRAPGVQRMAERPFYVVISVCTVATFWMAV